MMTHTHTHAQSPPRTQGVPYGDCFHVQTRWVLTRVGTTGKRCRLQIGLEVVFRQTVFLKYGLSVGGRGGIDDC